MNTMNAVKEYTIHDIEALTEDEARLLAVCGEIIPNVKDDYTLYLVDFPGYFGYSCLVYADGHHIYHANDYQLHHNNKTKEQLRDYYIRKMDSILFTEAEIAETPKDYAEYKRKDEFLHNYYGMRRDYQSIFGSCERKPNSVFNHVSFGYYDHNDIHFVHHHAKLHIKLNEAVKRMDNNDQYWVEAFLTEMYNHEYGINWEADFDTLSAFGNLHYYDDARLEDYFDQLNFNDTQRNAYYKARNKYYDEADL